MNTSCFRKEEKRIEAQWENTLLLPGCAGMPENIGDDLRRCILLLDGSLPTALLSVSGK